MLTISSQNYDFDKFKKQKRDTLYSFPTICIFVIENVVPFSFISYTHRGRPLTILCQDLDMTYTHGLGRIRPGLDVI